MKNWKTSLFGVLAVALPAIGGALGGVFAEVGNWLGKGALIAMGAFAADSSK